MRHLTIKTDEEICCMRRAGHVVEEVLLTMRRLARPGVSTIELNDIAAEVIKSHGATASFLGYRGFPYSICASVNEEVVHGFSGKRKLRCGDIFSVDVGAVVDGWHGDAARTFFIGEVAPETQKLVRVTRESFFEGVRFARPGNRLYDISAAIQNYAESFGYGVVRALTGHGIGRYMHEEPDIPNFRPTHGGRGLLLKKGMTLAIEPMINMGTHEVRVLRDGWTVVTDDGKPSAHYENTIAITDGDPILLTLSKEEYGPEVESSA
ncbi:MAG: type I methionyl aminopeptidase [Clostridiales bacterium]|jgi:methionyl aminopeptidase|nr:type I methionyl aminopeptidase [Clostridiales bacterium]